MIFGQDQAIVWGLDDQKIRDGSEDYGGNSDDKYQVEVPLGHVVIEQVETHLCQAPNSIEQQNCSLSHLVSTELAHHHISQHNNARPEYPCEQLPNQDQWAYVLVYSE